MQGKNILLTGASKGIGRAIAIKLAAEKVNIGVVARSQEELESLKIEIENLGSKCLIFVGSVADELFVKETINKMHATFGPIQFMINNAGQGIFGPLETISTKNWDDLFEVNVKGTFLFSKVVLPIMRQEQSGHIINIASDVAKRVFDGGSLYCASKYAQDAFSMALRKEVRKYGIKVSVIYSGLVDSMFHSEPQGDEQHADWLQVEDMANAIYYVMQQPKHVVIDELMIHPTSQDY